MSFLYRQYIAPYGTYYVNLCVKQVSITFDKRNYINHALNEKKESFKINMFCFQKPQRKKILEIILDRVFDKKTERK